VSADHRARQKAVDEVFARLPKVFRTESIKAEIADCVARSEGNYEEAALVSVMGMFTSIDRAFKRKTGAKYSAFFFSEEDLNGFSLHDPPRNMRNFFQRYIGTRAVIAR